MLPLPANKATMVYTKSEAVMVIGRSKFRSAERGAMMNEMIKRKWAPTSGKTLCRIMAQEEAGDLVLDTPWSGNGHNGGGRKRMLEEEDIDELVDEWKRGEAHGQDSIKDAIASARANLIERSGGVPLKLGMSPSDSTVSRVAAMIANHHGVSIVNKASGKSKHRVASEQSHRRTACLVGMVGSTHLLSVPEEDLDLREELKYLPEDTRVLYDAVSEARGAAVFPVKTHNIWSIDDSTVYHFSGYSSLSDKVKLVTSASVKASGSDSIWQLDENNSMKGMRVNMTFAFSGAGTCLPIVVCVSGLSDAELPGTDFLHLEVPGLCIGGGASIGNKQVGHILFMKSTPRAKQKKFKWYQTNIFIPGVNANRLEFDGMDVSTMSEIPTRETEVVSCDRDIPQLKAMLGNLNIYGKNSIILNKLSAAASAVEQGVDCCLVFKGIKT